MNEGGQSSTGQVSIQKTIPHAFHVPVIDDLVKQLIDFMITTHPTYGELKRLAEEQKISIHEGESHHSANKDCIRVVNVFYLKNVHCVCMCVCMCLFVRAICTGRMVTVLHDELEKLKKEKNVESFTELTKDMHFYPDLHGTQNFFFFFLSSSFYFQL